MKSTPPILAALTMAAAALALGGCERKEGAGGPGYGPASAPGSASAPMGRGSSGRAPDLRDTPVAVAASLVRTVADTEGPSPGESAPLSRAERSFVTDAAAASMFEVEVGRLAADKGSNPEVKALGRKLAAEHERAADELKQIARARKVTLPSELPPSKRQRVDRMVQLSGESFDAEFTQQVGVKDHQSDIKEFERASREFSDPQLKAWVERTLPALKEQLASAQRLNERRVSEKQ